MRFYILSCFVIMLCLTVFGSSQAQPVYRDHIEVELISELRQVAPGDKFWVGLRLKPDEHWHTYWRNPGDSGLETRIQWELPEGAQVGKIKWPYPERVDMAGIINYGYAGEVILLSEVVAPKINTYSHFDIKAKASWLVCDEICIPGDAELSLSLPYAKESALDTIWQAKILENQQRWPQILEHYQSRYSVQNNKVVIELLTEQLNLNDHLRYFPITGDVIEYSEPQSVSLDKVNQLIYIQQKKSGYFQQAPEKLNGVIVLSSAGNKRAYSIESILGDVSPPNLDDRKSKVDGSEVHSFFLILAFAFLGGFILNLMPCVFPVLSLKALNLINHRMESASSLRWQGIVYTLGVVLSFIGIAAIMLALREAGDRIGWGFQLQLPWFIALLIFVFFILALSLSGVLTIKVSWLGIGQSLTAKKGYTGSFFTGLLAALVATPCTAPFMGPAMGYAVTQTVMTSLFIFAFLGLGMAFPFLLLSFSPRIATYLPKPGRWMETFKQLMAFPLYLTVVYLLWVLGQQTDINVVAVNLVGLVVLSFAIWLNHLRVAGDSLRITLKLLAIVCVLFVFSIVLSLNSVSTDSGRDLHSQTFSHALLEKLKSENKIVFVNLTADWCITCKVNEQTTLNSEQVQAVFLNKQVEYLVGDWTLRDTEITEMLERFNRSGVPLYLVYRPGEQSARVLPQILTPSIVIKALE